VNTTDYSTSFAVDQSPEQVYAVINDVRRWWTGDITGDSAQVGDEFTYQYEEIHRSTQRITELVPGKRVVWHVTDGYLKFTSDPGEWTGTDLTFDITAEDGKTRVRFTHVGLRPASECYGSCSNAWGFYVNSSLREAIESAAS
jgi:hypothetical protein